MNHFSWTVPEVEALITDVQFGNFSPFGGLEFTGTVGARRHFLINFGNIERPSPSTMIDLSARKKSIESPSFRLILCDAYEVSRYAYIWVCFPLIHDNCWLFFFCPLQCLDVIQKHTYNTLMAQALETYSQLINIVMIWSSALGCLNSESAYPHWAMITLWVIGLKIVTP